MSSLQPPDILWIHWRVYNSIANTSKGVLFLPHSDAYDRSFLYLLYTLIKLYYTKLWAIKPRLWPQVEFFSSGGQESQCLFMVKQQPFTPLGGPMGSTGWPVGDGPGRCPVSRSALYLVVSGDPTCPTTCLLNSRENHVNISKFSLNAWRPLPESCLQLACSSSSILTRLFPIITM